MTSSFSYAKLLKGKNIGLLGRDVVYAITQSSQILHNGITTNLHEPCIWFDVSAYNTDTIDHYVYLDGVPILVKAGATMSLSDIPFVTFMADTSASAWVVKLAGTSLASLRGS